MGRRNSLTDCPLKRTIHLSKGGETTTNSRGVGRHRFESVQGPHESRRSQVRRRTRGLVLALTMLLLAGFPVASWADHDTRETTPNIVPRGEALQASGPGPFTNIHSDIAFWAVSYTHLRAHETKANLV